MVEKCTERKLTAPDHDSLELKEGPHSEFFLNRIGYQIERRELLELERQELERDFQEVWENPCGLGHGKHLQQPCVSGSERAS